MTNIISKLREKMITFSKYLAMVSIVARRFYKLCTRAKINAKMSTAAPIPMASQVENLWRMIASSYKVKALGVEIPERNTQLGQGFLYRVDHGLWAADKNFYGVPFISLGQMAL